VSVSSCSMVRTRAILCIIHYGDTAALFDNVTLCDNVILQVSYTLLNKEDTGFVYTSADEMSIVVASRQCVQVWGLGFGVWGLGFGVLL